MISKEEKEFLLKSSAHIKTNHRFNSLENKINFSDTKIENPKLNKNKKKWLIGGEVSGAILLAGAISLIIIFTGRYQNIMPLKSGEIENFVSLKGFGIASKEIVNKDQVNNANPFAKQINKANGLSESADLISNEPVNFYQLNKDNNLEKSTLKTETGEDLKDYHVSLYYEDNDFIRVTLHSTKNLNIDEYNTSYEFTTRYNAFALSTYLNDYSLMMGKRGDIWVDKNFKYGYNYLISKRSGKIYLADNPLSGYVFGFDSLTETSFYSYEDGYIVDGRVQTSDDSYSNQPNLFLAREVNNEIELKLILNYEQLKAFMGGGEIFGFDSTGMGVDRYGNPVIYGDTAYIGGKIVNNIRYDELNRTIYKVDDEGYVYYLNKENEFIKTTERGRNVSLIKNVSKFSEEEKEEQNIFNLYFFRGKGRSTLKYKNDNYFFDERYKFTLLNQENKEAYREYKIEEIPVAIDWEGSYIQNNNLYTLVDNNVYVLNLETLEYEQYDCHEYRIRSLNVNARGDIILKGYAKDELKEVTAYIVDGIFTTEYKDIEESDLTYYIKPLN